MINEVGSGNTKGGNGTSPMVGWQQKKSANDSIGESTFRQLRAEVDYTDAS
jgi:hypothetical protein